MFLGVLDVYLRPPIDWYRCLGLNPSSQKVGLTPLPVYGYESIVSERVRWQLRSLMHHNECCNAENSKV
jgi:hypothetical protein